MGAQAKIDRIALSQLQSRYGIGRTAVYSRVQALQIEPERKGNKAFINSRQLQLLDDLHEHLAHGDSMVEALEKMGRQAVKESEMSSKLFSELYSEQIRAKGGEEQSIASLAVVMREIAQVTEQILQGQRQFVDPLAPQRALEEACQNHWQLSTSQLAQILDLSIKNLGRYKSFERYGFTLTKSGRHGSQATWTVTKPESTLKQVRA